MSTSSIPTTIPHAYRHLLRALLQAVRYSKPARFVLRDRLRLSFRDPARQDNPFFPGETLPAGHFKVARAEARPGTMISAAARRPGQLNEEKLARTLELLRGAAAVQGPEHKLVKNLVYYWGERELRREHQGNAEKREHLDARIDGYVERMAENLGIYTGRQ